MNKTIRVYLDFVRFPNLFTAAADVIAGVFFSLGHIEWSNELGRLVLGSVCLYAGGVALNDVCDAEKDARERPSRPIPSGEIPLPHARLVSMMLLTLGATIAASTSLPAAIIAISLLSCIVLYDLVFKSTVAAPALMGMCRALNFMLGMCLSNALSPSPWIAVGLIWLYVTSLTFFARQEASSSTSTRLIMGTIGMGGACAGLFMLDGNLFVEFDVRSLLVFAAILFLTHNGFRAVQDPTPATIQSAVKTFVIFIVVFDALIAASEAGLKGGLIVLILIAPTVLAARLLRVT